jgi:hypothetical protein
MGKPSTKWEMQPLLPTNSKLNLNRSPNMEGKLVRTSSELLITKTS